MKEQSSAEAIQRLLRPVLITDAVIAVIVGIACILLELYTLEAYGTLLVWAGPRCFSLPASSASAGLRLAWKT